MKAVLASLAALFLVGCGGDAGENATPTPTPTPTATSSPTSVETSRGMCAYLENVVVAAIANAEARVDLNVVNDTLGQAQVQIQELAVDLIDRERSEPFGRAILDLGSSLAKIRFGIASGDPDQITAFTDEARLKLRVPAIRERCGEISTGEA